MSDEMVEIARQIVDCADRGEWTQGAEFILARALLASREEIEQWKQRWSDACELARERSVECEEMRAVYEAARDLSALHRVDRTVLVNDNATASAWCRMVNAIAAAREAK